MPTVVERLFQENGKEILGQIKWGHQLDCVQPGVYVVALTNQADKMLCYNEAPISEGLVEEWVNRVPYMTLDRTLPTVNTLTKRLKDFWLPDETVLYIGKAGTSLQQRVNQYYKTTLGSPGLHRGGHWLKTLNNLTELNIYWTTSEGSTAHDLESVFLDYFVKRVSCESRKILRDPIHPFPFANIEFPKGVRKDHGLRKQTT